MKKHDITANSRNKKKRKKKPKKVSYAVAKMQKGFGNGRDLQGRQKRTNEYGDEYYDEEDAQSANIGDHGLKRD